MFKKIGSCLLALTMLLSISLIQVEAVDSEYFDYTITNNEVTINGYVGTETNIRIPESIDGYKVTKISAFFRAEKPKLNEETETYELEKLYIPKTIREIDDKDEAAWLFGSINEIELDKDNKYFLMENKCLYSLDKTELYYMSQQLDSFEVPKEVRKMNLTNLFYTKLKELLIPCNVKKFWKTEPCIYLPKSMTNLIIDSPTFECWEIHSDSNTPYSVTYGENIKSVENCFRDNLKNIYLSKNVDEIYQDSFENAHNIEKIIVDNNNHIFSSKDGVLFKGSELYVYPQGKEDSTYFIPDFVKSFDSYSFWKVKNLKNIYIPKDTSPTGEYTFFENGQNIYVYNNSNAMNYCIKNNLNYKIIDEKKDKSTNIEIISGTCTNIDESTELKVSQLKEGNDYDEVSKSFENFDLYDIGFYKDNEKVEIDGTAIVKIPVKEGMNENKCKVYYNDNGTYTDMNAVYKDGYMEFKTDHFSQYVLTDNELPTTSLGDVNGDGEINFLDAIMVLRHDAEIIELEENQLKAADVNKDGEVNFLDAIMILRYDAEIIDSFN
ncbi:dockerin type I domain-containing protein [Faecalibacillus intestinalis]|uniref:dockerin type I domain-containing protein n=1 Tax=Faecalibacillus intestinalis TaxID=1982626 RepID=UPI00352156ED